MPDTFHSLNYHDDRLLNQMREAFLAGGGGISPAIQAALDSLQTQINGISSIHHQTSVTLNNSQILALPTTPIALVPETETLNYVGTPIRLPILIRAVAHWGVYEGTLYGNVSPDFLGIFIGSDAGNGPVSYLIEQFTFLNQGAFGPIEIMGAGVIQNDAIFGARLFDPRYNLKDSIQDNGLYFGGTNGFTGNFTGGHATNQLRVSLVYLIYNLQTGLFE